MEPRVQYCTTSDGVRIAYWKMGEGEPLIMTPNNGYSHIGLEWQNEANRRVYERLAAQRTLVRYDGRGAGLSQRDAVDFSIEARGLDLEAMVRALGHGPAVIVALGNLGPGAIRFAAENPDRVTQLVLYDSFISKSEAVDELSGAASEALADALSERDLGYLGRTWAAMMGVDPEWYSSYLKASISPAAFKQLMQHARGGGQDCSAWVSKVNCPCLVIHEQWPGEDSQYSVRLAAALPDAQLTVIERTVSDPWGEMADMSPLVYRFLGLPFQEADAPAQRAIHVATVLFTDIVGHTQMMSRLGDERGREVLREHERITREVLKAHGGTEVKTMGDGFMASFGSVTKAVECAVALQRAIDERNAGAVPKRAHPSAASASSADSAQDSLAQRDPSTSSGRTDVEQLSIRVGLNAGEPIEEEGRDGRGDLFGATVILASRIAAKAEGGEILVADTVRGLCSGKGFLFADRGDFVAKGFEEPVRVYEVRWRE